MKRKPGVITGYAMKHLFKKPATIKYPYDKLKIEPNYRGKLKYDPDDCIGCNLCVRRLSNWCHQNNKCWH